MKRFFRARFVVVVVVVVVVAVVVVVIGISYVVIIDKIVIVFCHFSVCYNKKIKMEEKERKSEKKVTKSEFSTGRLKRSIRERFLMKMHQIKVSLYLVIVTSL